MKLLRLRLANLNSLYGEWRLNFEDPAYLAHGLFAITGPTGAGKSTLLDAITLALYGRTPRLGMITNSENEVMSRDCGACFAEVTFQSAKGRFCAHWSQKRARGKGSGNLQAPKHELIDAESQRIITVKRQETLAAVQDVVGLDYDQFMRSIMLAQGEFATFLKSEDGARAAILAKITGTDVYARIGMAAFQRYRTESQALQTMSAQSESIELLSDEDSAAIQQRIRDIAAELVRTRAERAKAEEAIRWLEHRAQLEKESLAMREEVGAATVADEAAAPLRASLQLAQRAQPLKISHEELRQVDSRINEAEETLLQLRVKLRDAEKCKLEALKRLEQATRELDEARRAIENNQGLWKEVYGNDLQIQNMQAALADVTRELETIDYQRAIVENAKQEKQARYQVIEESIVQNRRPRDGSPSDAAGDDRSAAIELISREINDLETARIEIQGEQTLDAIQQASDYARNAKMQWSEHRQRLTSIIESETSFRQCVAEQRRIETLIAEHQQRVASLESQLQQQKTHLETLQSAWQHEQLIASLEVQRSRLVPGQPCDLCGSIHHPYVDEGSLPQPGLTEPDLVHAREELSQLNEKLAAATRELDRSEIDFNRLHVDAMKLSQTISDARSVHGAIAEQNGLSSEINESALDRIEQTIAEFQAREQTLLEQARHSRALLEMIAMKRKAVSDLRVQQAEAERVFQAMDKERLQLEGQLATFDAQLADLTRQQEINQAKLESRNKELHKLKEDRHAAYGDRDPQADEQMMRQQVEVVKVKFDEQTLECEPLNRAWQQLDREVLRIETTLSGDRQRREQLSARFERELLAAGFNDRGLLETAIQNVSMIEPWSNEIQRLETAARDARVRLSQKESELKAWENRRTSEQSLEILQQQSQNLDRTLDERVRLQIDLQQQLENNQKKHAEWQQARQQLEIKRQEVERWTLLNELIGSADGAKFRKFAQGITFELLIAYANAQLRSLTDRFLLKKREEGLGLVVIDHYQSSRARSAANLSGGETFLVSLALALGLSKLASQNVQIDSLFLDEGFGTLDEEALDEALHTLANLRQEGKLVGLISHVAALNQQIPVRIEVIKGPLGRSRLSGPGVTQAVPTLIEA